MRTMLSILATAAVTLTGCASTAPGWESRFGDAARQARALQVIDPDAPSRHRQLAMTDGKAAAGAMKAYAESYGYAVQEAKQPALSISTTSGR
ncbi:hypothetical protein [Piscinibacter sp.]|uniref:hypothetical protein n=1 Tax=Piscinibacter sp. TaxID=1903157 RepID=UPI002BEB65D1|nr:hypothetical protein [Albitalea sp.]HUG26555.1 hypothetical protein [Albitalea sp.]